MSLADELLADLEEIAEDGDADEEKDAGNQSQRNGEEDGDPMELDGVDADSIRSIAKLRDSQQVCACEILNYVRSVTRSRVSVPWKACLGCLKMTEWSRIWLIQYNISLDRLMKWMWTAR